MVTSVLCAEYVSVHVCSTAACIHSVLPSLFVKPVLSTLKVPEASTPIFAFAGLAHIGLDRAGFKDGLFGV